MVFRFRAGGQKLRMPPRCNRLRRLSMIEDLVLRFVLLLTLALCAGCASYATPGGPAPLPKLAAAETPAAGQPTLSFPISLHLVRIQAADYQSFSMGTLVGGSFSAVASAELATPPRMHALAQWPLIADVQTLRTDALPPQLETLDDLRLAAAKSLADVLIIYTVDTRFESGGESLSPLAELSLGKAPEQETHIQSVASALLLDVRTGYQFGAVQASARVDDLDGAWLVASALDRKRLDAEQQAFAALLAEVEKLWTGIAAQNGFTGSDASAATAVRG